MKKPSPPSIVTLAIMTTVTIIFWIFFSVYQILTNEQPVDVPAELLKPLNPTLDLKALDYIENSLYFEENEVVELQVVRGVPTENPITPTSPPLLDQEVPTANIDSQQNAATDSGQLIDN